MPATLEAAKRVVIKIGSSLLFDQSDGVRYTWLNSMADDIQGLVRQDKQVIVVSSGAIALGRQILKLTKQKLRLDESQAAASVGQIELGRIFREVFEQRNLDCGQVLLTFEDTEVRRRYLNARATINSLLRMNVIPVVNENDTVATSEIRFGDNDRLSARVASMTGADLLILLSDVDGLYTKRPDDPDAQFVDRVEKITPAIETMAGGPGSQFSSGGMVTKIEAAKIATQSGVAMIIALGSRLNPIDDLRQSRHTIFEATESSVSAKRKWIVGDLKINGSVTIDDGAKIAVNSKNSLLPVGVIEVKGQFDRGDVIEILGPDHLAIGRGLAAYDSKEAELIKGRRTDEIGEILHYFGPENLIHRDDMVIFETSNRK